MNFNKFINSDYLKSNPLCGIGTYKDELNLATGDCTRQIKTLVLTGVEYWQLWNGNYFSSVIDRKGAINTIVCSHFINSSTGGISYNRLSPVGLKIAAAVVPFVSSVSELKEYLAAQYANGTPVTVWYVLAEPTTETITVPSGLSGTEEGYLNQSGTPTPTNPIYPTANTIEKWFDINHYIMGTSTDTITTPADIYANDTTATVGLKGQMEQSSQPSPTTPIQPSECGERTGNLYFKKLAGANISDSGAVTTLTGFDLYIAEVEQGVRYSGTGYIYAFFENVPAIGSISYSGSRVVDSFVNIVSPINGYVAVRASNTAQNVMCNTGSTVLPYEPYGVKIPILSADTTTNIYLGEVQSTRKIYKQVFNGTETGWRKGSSFFFNQELNPDYLRARDTVTVMCTHYQAYQQVGAGGNVPEGYCSLYYAGEVQRLYIVDSRFTTLEDFTTYLAQQYANGTPVTIWYVLATPQTAVVNEPLRKIGDYADEVSGITIPTIAGANTISVGTTLQPSEVTVNYKGWHSVADVHVYPDSSWMPTSWEEFRKAVRSGKAQSLYPVGTKLYENWGDTTSDAWIVVNYPTGEDYLDSDLAQQGYTNRVMLMEEKLNYLRQFDAIEAWLYVETAIPAGTYRFTIPNYDTSYGGNKTYIFTSTANVPVGGQLTLTWAYQQNPSAVQAYSSATSTSALFNVSITEWDGTTACTDLGTIKLAQNDPDSTYGKLNHIHRARYGSNNYYQSGYRQWLNTNASANWWTPTNVFDRPYGNRTNTGRLNVMNSNMKSVLATPTVNCITNNLFEYPSLDGTTFSLQTAYTVTDKLFPVTHSEVNLSSSPNVNSVLDYYVGKGNADRIKYRKDNGNAYYWWLRTPFPTSAYTVRFVFTSGALNGSYAYGTSGSAAACIIQ